MPEVRLPHPPEPRRRMRGWSDRVEAWIPPVRPSRSSGRSGTWCARQSVMSGTYGSMTGSDTAEPMGSRHRTRFACPGGMT